MRKLLYIALPVLVLAACTKNIDRFNTETKKPANVPGPTLFSNAVKNTSDGLANASVNVNVFRFTVKHWAMAVYQDEAQYDFTTRGIPQAWWTRFYRDVLNDLKEANRVISNDALLDAGVKQNQLAIVDIMQVYAYNVLVNTFGNVTYKEALDPNHLFPVYDDAKTIYTDLLKRLAEDITKLNAASAGFAAADDLIYGGSVAKWTKFANSLQLKMGMLLADSDPAAAKAAVEAADAKAFTASSDDAALKYLATSPNTNPLHIDIVLGGRSDYIAAEDLMNPLIALNDPRKSLFFGTNNDGKYAGGVVGKVNTFADFSKPSAKVIAPDAANVLLDYTEIEFYRAEAKARGFNVAGTIEEHYNKGVTASILTWGGSAADAATYLAQPNVAYATAPGATYKEKIAFQKWIALFNRPFDGWVEVRRLDYPALTPPVGALSGFPNRFPYPNNEQQLNGTNYTAAAAIMGNDKVTTKLFWDKF